MIIFSVAAYKDYWTHKNVTVPECCSIVGKKKWMRLHFPSFLHCTTKPNQTIIIVVIVVSKPSSLPKPCTGIYLDIVKSRNLRTLGKKMSGLFQLTLRPWGSSLMPWPYVRGCGPAWPRWCLPCSPRAWGRYQRSTLSGVHHGHVLCTCLHMCVLHSEQCTSTYLTCATIRLCLQRLWAEKGKRSHVSSPKLARGCKVLHRFFVHTTNLHIKVLCLMPWVCDDILCAPM